MTGIKIFFAAAFGALIGALTALQIADHSFWAALVGFLVGGLVGYLSYEFKVIVITVKKAWRKMPYFFSGSNRENLKAFGLVVLATLCITATISLVFHTLVFITSKAEIYWVNFLIEWGITWCLLGGLPIAASAINWYNLPNVKLELKWMCRNLNPITALLFWPPALVIRGLWSLIMSREKIFDEAVAVASQIGIFIRRIYVEIHSDVRLMLFIDSGLGAVVGYATGNALIGTFVGGVLGVLNYYLVATFILGLTPKGTEPS